MGVSDEMNSEVYQSMMEEDAKYESQIMGLYDRIKACPDDMDTYEQGYDVCEKAYTKWGECEHRLRDMYEKSNDNEEKAMLAREINEAENKFKLYKFGHHSNFTHYKVENTSKLYKFGKSLGEAGDSMKSVGSAMSSTGDKMTIGCTVPAIAIGILIFLLMLIF